jgi:hypothetical protein
VGRVPVPVPEAGKWEPRSVLLMDVVLLVFQVRVVARQQQGHAHATQDQRVGAADLLVLYWYKLYLNMYGGYSTCIVYTVGT